MIFGADSIFIAADGGDLTEMGSQPFESEDLLQGLLARCPDLLAGGQMAPDAPLRWTLVRREFGVPITAGGYAQFSADHLFLDQHGVPTIVEVKRSTNTEIRRKIVGQMLDYAANGIRYWPPESLRAVHDATCTAAGKNATEDLLTLLAPGGDIEAFWTQVATNLAIGKVRMVFVADRIPPELKRIVEFLNEQLTHAEVFAVEVRQYVNANHRALVPRLIGDTSTAQITKRGPSYETLLAEADESVRMTVSLLDTWAAERHLSTHRTKAGKQYTHDGIGFVAQVYPRWATVDLWLNPIIEAGLDVELSGLRRDLATVTEQHLAEKLPSVPCRDLASNWPVAVGVLDRYVEALELANAQLGARMTAVDSDDAIRMVDGDGCHHPG